MKLKEERGRKLPRHHEEQQQRYTFQQEYLQFSPDHHWNTWWDLWWKFHFEKKPTFSFQLLLDLQDKLEDKVWWWYTRMQEQWRSQTEGTESQQSQFQQRVYCRQCTRIQKPLETRETHQKNAEFASSTWWNWSQPCSMILVLQMILH